jgi:hypothetical protein
LNRDPNSAVVAFYATGVVRSKYSCTAAPMLPP